MLRSYSSEIDPARVAYLIDAFDLPPDAQLVRLDTILRLIKGARLSCGKLARTA